ncbi:MAG: Nif3-like dinuclear metal center hexameric protein [Bacteroidales bacterium]
MLTSLMKPVLGQEKASSIINSIIEKTGNPALKNTVDVFKTGNPSDKVTGIVTCMFATMDVLQKAVELKCNLIIAHEPLFYNHEDKTIQFTGDQVFEAKKKFIANNKLIIWRFHDYIHMMKPDGISTGMAKKFGWEPYKVNGEEDHFVIPSTTLRELIAYLKILFPENTFNVVGDPLLQVSNIRVAAGAPGSGTHFSLLRKEDTDVVIAGEVPQWETYEYVRDAIQQGRKKAIIFLGHIPSEEAGMEYAATWLKGFITGIPVYFIKSGPSYWSY